MGLDVNQTITYYNDAYDENGSYQLWALKHQNESNNTYLETVSPAYFYTASIVWVMPAFLCSFGSSLVAIFEDEFDDDAFLPEFALLVKTCISKNVSNTCTKCVKALVLTALLPISTSIVAIFLYLYLPIGLFLNALKAAIEGDDYDEKEEYYGVIDGNALNAIKFYEVIGEALPQLILNIVFIANNFEYLLEYGDYFGVSVPTYAASLTSAVFSFGSLLMGFKSGCTACDCCDEDTVSEDSGKET